MNKKRQIKRQIHGQDKRKEICLSLRIVKSLAVCFARKKSLKLLPKLHFSDKNVGTML